MLLLQAGQLNYPDQGMNKQEWFPKENLSAKSIMYFTAGKNRIMSDGFHENLIKSLHSTIHQSISSTTTVT